LPVADGVFVLIGETPELLQTRPAVRCRHTRPAFFSHELLSHGIEVLAQENEDDLRDLGVLAALPARICSVYMTLGLRSGFEPPDLDRTGRLPLQQGLCEARLGYRAGSPLRRLKSVVCGRTQSVP